MAPIPESTIRLSLSEASFLQQAASAIAHVASSQSVEESRLGSQRDVHSVWSDWPKQLDPLAPATFTCGWKDCGYPMSKAMAYPTAKIGILGNRL